MNNERTREWIHKPVFHGAPVSWAQKYFQGRLEEFRDEHKEFDEFLNEIGELINLENNHDFDNIKKFISGESEANWVSPKQSLFDVLIKLFNLCLSPKQTSDYMKECLAQYKTMLEADYILSGEPQISLRKDTWDGKESKFISFRVKPTKDIENRNYGYCFEITTSLKIIEDDLNDIRTHIDEFELRSGLEIFEDALMLFEYYQNRGLLRKVFNTGINQLETQGVIKEVSQENFYGLVIHQYETNLKISNK